MKPQLNDIRILKLAQMYEIAYETFLRDVAARVVDDPELGDADHAGRIERHLVRLVDALEPSDDVGIQRAALMDVRDIEAAAERFFRDHADRVHDPEVAALFRDIADEERAHVRAADEMLRTLASRTAGADPRDPYATAWGGFSETRSMPAVRRVLEVAR